MRVPARELIGRREELKTLERALAEAARGAFRLVVITGQPGIGKTALVSHFVHLAAKRGARTVLAECTPEDMTRPFGPLLHVAGASTRGSGANETTSLFGAPDRNREFARIAAQLRSAASARPLVLILDDMQWGDDETIGLLPYLGRRAADAALLVVATFRSDDVAASPRLSAAVAELRRMGPSEIELAPLAPRQIGVLIRAVLSPVGRPDPELVEFVAERSGGNPLFAEEIVRALASRGWVHLDGGWWRATRPLGDIALPTSIVAGVRARLAEVSPASRRILSTGAVIGMSFTFDLLVSVARSDRPAVVSALRDGIAARLLEEGAGDERFSFRHALFREACIAELIGPERRDLHLAVGLALEDAVPEERRGSIAVELAGHFDAAGDGERAYRYHVLALRGSRLGVWPRVPRNLSGHAGAHHLERALALGPTDAPDRAELLIAYAWTEIDNARRLALIEQGLAAAQAAGQEALVATATLMAGLSRAMAGETDAIQAIRDGIRLLEPFGVTADLADGYFELGRMAMIVGDPEAIPLTERALELAKRLELPGLVANCLITLGLALVRTDRIEGIALIQEGIALHRDHVVPPVIGRGLINLWLSLLEAGAPDDDVRKAEGIIERESIGSADLVDFAYLDDEWDAALQVADEFPRAIPDPIRTFIEVARQGPRESVAELWARHERLAPLLSRGSPYMTEVFYLRGEHRAALAASAVVARAMERRVGHPFLDSAAVTATAAAVAAGDDAAIEAWSDRCAVRHRLETRVAEGRRAYARAERAIRDGRRDEGLAALALASELLARRGSSILARSIPRLRRAELLAEDDPATAQRELAGVMAMWRAVDAKWYLDRLREWAAAHGLRGWTVSARRGTGLTPREMEVARSVADGLTNKEIASALGITERTAETHVQRILTKLDLRGRAQLAAWVGGGQLSRA